MTIAHGAFGHGFLGIKPVEAAIAATTRISLCHRIVEDEIATTGARALVRPDEPIEDPPPVPEGQHPPIR